MMAKGNKQIGWQIVDPDGYNIHGDDEDPFDLPSFAILVDEARNCALAWTEQNPEFKIAPVHDGDIEEPIFISDHIEPIFARQSKVR